jgi:hypothetical protein
LGDIVPSKRDMMIVNFALILVGLGMHLLVWRKSFL